MRATLDENKALLLFSGGLDSTYMLIKLLMQGYTVTPLIGIKISSQYRTYDQSLAHNALSLVKNLQIPTGQVHIAREFNYAHYALPSGQEVGRHLLFISPIINAALETKSSVVGIGLYADKKLTTFPDARTPFVNAMRQMFKESDVPLKVMTLSEPNKATVLAKLNKLKYIESVLHTARWCFMRSEDYMRVPGTDVSLKGCGKCLSCKIMKDQYKIFWEKHVN